jgi:hypothetical protein
MAKSSKKTASRRARAPRSKRAPRRVSVLSGVADMTHVNAARLLLPQAIPILKRYPGVVGVGVGLRRDGKRHTAEAVFVVNVSKVRDGTQPGQVPPASLLGIPVDVQETGVPSLRSAICGGGDVRRHAVSELGHIALMAQDGAGTCYALTAYHVLGREVFGTLVRQGDPPPFGVEARMFLGSFESVGELVAAEFDGDADIACIRLSANHSASPVLLGSNVRLLEPIDPMTLPLGSGVRMVVPGRGTLRGALVHYPVGGSFLTENGIADFTGLAQFQLAAPEIPHGWSGSILFEPTNARPVAVLSFAADGVGPGGNSYAYGFPLNAHYQSWGLRPI